MTVDQALTKAIGPIEGRDYVSFAEGTVPSI